VRILGLEGPPGVVQRLLEMGLTEGTVVGVVRAAPLGDPLEVRVRGYRLSVRKDDARLVRVVPA
jgi:Fe2+ transport system protein FeoA